MRVTLVETFRPVELKIGVFSFDWALTTVAAFQASFPHKTLIFCYTWGMSTLRSAAPVFTRLAGWSFDSTGVALSSSV